MTAREPADARVSRGVLTIRCACGWETTGVEDEVVAATADHGERIHNMRASREEILAMAVAPSE